MIDFTGRMYRAGIPLVAGTDEMPGFTLQRELELYVQAMRQVFPNASIDTFLIYADAHSSAI